MKKRNVFLLGLLVILLAMELVFVGCGDGSGGNNNGGGGGNNNSSGGGLSGTWRGNVMGVNATVTITSNGWTLSAPGFSDRGTYIMDGITARLISTTYNLETGTAVLLDSNTISVTLNSNSIAPGTYTLYRQ